MLTYYASRENDTGISYVSGRANEVVFKKSRF